MMSKVLKIVIIALFVLFPIYSVSAVGSLDVVINEIAWMGTEANSSDEWIELYNNTNQDVNLDSWGLYEAGGTTLIEPLTGIIEAKSYYLIERTDDTTVSNISASQEPTSWSGYGLKNSGEHLQLLDNTSQVIDEVNCIDGWFAGDNSTKQTMERIGSDWQTSQDPEGTPKRENYELRIANYEEPEEKPELVEPEFEQITVEPEKPIEDGPLYVYTEKIVFNEVLPSPDGPDAENEWIEIYNQNDFEVDLSGWKIQDTAGSTKIHTLNKKIPALGYLIFLRPETKITLNNDGDGLTLIDPKGTIINSISFGKASLNKSYSKTQSGWTWTINLTPGEKNIIPTTTAKPSSQKQTINFTKNENQESVEIGSQRISLGADTEKSSRISVFFIAFIVALLCSISFLIIKSNLKSFWY